MSHREARKNLNKQVLVGLHPRSVTSVLLGSSHISTQVNLSIQILRQYSLGLPVFLSEGSHVM